MSACSNLDILIDKPERDTLHNQDDTAHSARGDSSLPSPFGTRYGLQLPSKAGVEQGSIVSAKEPSWNIDCVVMVDGIVDYVVQPLVQCPLGGVRSTSSAL